MNESERIGNDERDAAVAALRSHHAAGRLDSFDYEDRSLRARQARTRGELDQLFTDLPAPGPRPGRIAQPGPTGTPTVPPADHQAGLIPEPFGYTIVAAAPILAVILFFVTGSWLWFLAIPVVGIVVYGPQGGRRGGRRERRW